jgi:hypothetical protein
VGSEYFINSQELEDKVRTLLPSQGGAGAGFDLSASTQIIPIIDLTESAEGSNLRADLQTSFSHNSTTSTTITNTTTTLINNTGYFRVFGNAQLTSAQSASFKLNDGSTTKNLVSYVGIASDLNNTPFDFIVFLSAGDSFQAVSSGFGVTMYVSTRQIADINGQLVDPT